MIGQLDHKTLDKSHPFQLEKKAFLLAGMEGNLVVSVVQLKEKQGVYVSRIFLENGETYIAKHITWDKIAQATYSTIPPSLQYETCNYTFLHSISDFSNAAQLIAQIPGLIILEDLGSDDFQFQNEEQAQRVLMDSLIRLHTTSRNRKESYLELKKRFEIPEQDHRKKTFSDPKMHYGIAKQWLVELIHENGADIESLETELHQVEKVISSPGHFDAFLHNDFVSRRQSVVKNKKFYLIDFEHSLYNHALLDIAKIYLGKVEYNLKDGTYFRKCAPFVEGIHLHYKEKWLELTKTNEATVGWDVNWSSVMVHQTLYVIGQLLVTQYSLKQQGVFVTPKQHLSHDLKSLSVLNSKLLGGSFPVFQSVLEKVSTWSINQNSISFTVNTNQYV